MGHCGLEYGGKVRPGRPTAIQPRIFRRRIIARLKQEHFIVQILTVRDQTGSIVEDNNPGALQARRVRGRTGLFDRASNNYGPAGCKCFMHFF